MNMHIRVSGMEIRIICITVNEISMQSNVLTAKVDFEFNIDIQNIIINYRKRPLRVRETSETRRVKRNQSNIDGLLNQISSEQQIILNRQHIKKQRVQNNTQDVYFATEIEIDIPEHN